MSGWKIQRKVAREDYEFIDFVADKVPELQASCQTRTMVGWNGTADTMPVSRNMFFLEQR